MISGYILGDRALLARLDAFPAAAKARVDLTVQALGLELERRVKTNYLRGPRPAKLGVVTGRLLSSITRGGADSRTRFESTPQKSVYYVGTNVPYGAMWEHGIAAHDVVPVRALALRFEIGGQVFFRRKVHIPQQAPRPFLQPALDDMKDRITDKLGEALKAAAQGINKP